MLNVGSSLQRLSHDVGLGECSVLQVPSILVDTLGIKIRAQGSAAQQSAILSYAGKAALLLVMIDEEQWLRAC